MSVLEETGASGAVSVHFVADTDDGVRASIGPDRRVHVASLAKVGSKDELLSVVAEALELPDYFGYNWDALDECPGDLDGPPSQGCLLVLRDAAAPWHTIPADMLMLTITWTEASNEWRAEGRAFHLVFVP